MSRAEALLRMCFARELSVAELYTMFGYNVAVPPLVREAPCAPAFDNGDLLPAVGTPVLITHGAADAARKPLVVEQHKAAMPHAHVHLIPEAGHAPFWDAAASFKRRLGNFCEEVARGELVANQRELL